jgi:CRISPR-associated Csx2 family protein
MKQSENNLKIISFLGFNNYTEVTYLHPDFANNPVKVVTPFYQEALVKFFNPKTLYILLTASAENKIPNGAKESNWLALKKKLADRVDLKPITNIPENNTPEDIWSIFDRVTNCLETGDEVIFDITHSFRSIPIVALLAVSYLRVVRQVNIKGLLYGAYEARKQIGEKPSKDDETPSFDLFPIVSLLDWTTATDQFIKTGNGEALADLLNNNECANQETKKLADNISNISRGLQMLRPMDVMNESAQLPENIQEATPTISQEIPPFATLLKRVEADYSKFGLVNPQQQNNAKASLIKQLKMVEWYINKQEIVQALSVAREWLPSLLCYHFKLDMLDKNNREEMELLLGGKIKDSEGNTIRESKYLPQWELLAKKTRKSINRLWGGDYDLANLRNDVLHAGYRKNSRDADKILEQTREIFKQLNAIALDWGIFSE